MSSARNRIETIFLLRRNHIPSSSLSLTQLQLHCGQQIPSSHPEGRFHRAFWHHRQAPELLELQFAAQFSTHFEPGRLYPEVAGFRSEERRVGNEVGSMRWGVIV